ncbi:hypothetical protein ACFY36_19445 [Actinoplanes sp. NPDC000266]
MTLGSLAEIISAVGAIAAVIAASFAARAALKTNRQHSSEIELIRHEGVRSEEREQRSQADQIACWATIDRDSNMPTVCWINHSGLPVYDLTFWVVMPPFETVTVRYSIGPPRHEERNLRRVEEKVRTVGSADNSTVPWTRILDTGKFRSAVSFRDIFGTWWLRGFDGVLLRCACADEADEKAAAMAHDIAGQR